MSFVVVKELAICMQCYEVMSHVLEFESWRRLVIEESRRGRTPFLMVVSCA